MKNKQTLKNPTAHTILNLGLRAYVLYIIFACFGAYRFFMGGGADPIWMNLFESLTHYFQIQFRSPSIQFGAFCKLYYLQIGALGVMGVSIFCRYIYLLRCSALFLTLFSITSADMVWPLSILICACSMQKSVGLFYELSGSVDD